MVAGGAQPREDHDRPVSFEDLVRVMATLRGPGGCPWDRQQTHASLRPYLLEEAYEVLDAIERDDPERLRDELGDLLLQVVFHAQIASEAGRFTIDDVVRAIHDKLIRRHPHVFPDPEGKGEDVRTPEEVLRRWEVLKRAERGEEEASAVPSSLPALMWAEKLYRRAWEAGGERPSTLRALREAAGELEELGRALERQNAGEIHERIGALLMAVVRVAACAGVDAETALRDACRKFASAP